MIIKINGKEEIVERPLNLIELVLQKSLVPDHIVIEHNFKIIPKDEWNNIALKENDNIEIISFVGGG